MTTPKSRASVAGRSVQDYITEEELKEALLSVASQNLPADSKTPDWILPVPDPEAEEQTVEGELQRLLVLKSYLLLDAEKEEAFDKLTEEACKVFGVPTSLISLIDLGRQFLFSNTGCPGDIRETSRAVAFCSHTIFNKKGIIVVNDTKKDDRFMNSPLVTDGPRLRFYAGAPLISPEGYKLGTFCVEGPDPRPEGLTEEEKLKLKEYAAKAMALMVERRNVMRQKLSRSPDPVVLRHAGVTTNLGVHMLYANQCLTAMKLFQEALQTLMYVEGDNQSGLPGKERQEQMEKLHALFSTEMLTDQSRQVLVDGVNSLYQMVAEDSATKHLPGIPKPGEKHDSCVDNSIPGLFPQDTKFKIGRASYPLSFGEPFKINLYSPPGDNTIDFKQFTIPLYQCSKATMFNMGLIHYHWGSADSAVQFFDLAASLSHKKPQTDALAFDPVVLACLNNIAQINLQYRRPADAMEMLADALTRGNAALAKLYASHSHSVSPNSSSSSLCSHSEEQPDNPSDITRTLRLRKKLSRTLLNMGHVHFYNCNYDAAITTCKDALRLMHTNLDDPEVAAMWYNMAVLDFHKGDKMASLKNLEKFLEMSQHLQGPDNIQVAEALHRRGQILYEIGDLYQCIKPLNEALIIRQKKYGDDHPLSAETLFAIGKAYLAREEFEYALNAYNQCLAIQRKHSPDDESSFDVAQTLLDIGRAHHAQNNFKDALVVYREAADLTRKFFGDRHAFVARIQNIIGSICAESGLIDESVAAFKEAAEIRTEQGLPVHMNTAADDFVNSSNTSNSVAPPA